MKTSSHLKHSRATEIFRVFSYLFNIFLCFLIWRFLAHFLLRWNFTVHIIPTYCRILYYHYLHVSKYSREWQNSLCKNIQGVLGWVFSKSFLWIDIRLKFPQLKYPETLPEQVIEKINFQERKIHILPFVFNLFNTWHYEKKHLLSELFFRSDSFKVMQLCIFLLSAIPHPTYWYWCILFRV